MDYSATGLQEWVRDALSTLSEHPRFGTRAALHVRLVEMTGISLSTIQKFHQHSRDGNLSVENLDKMAAAVRELQRRQVA